MAWMLPDFSRASRSRHTGDAAEQEAITNETSAAPRVLGIDEDRVAKRGRIAAPGAGTVTGTLRRRMEERLRTQLGDVRVHDGGDAAESARRSGRWRIQPAAISFSAAISYLPPETEAGESLLAHELSHVAQQGGGGALQRQPQPQQAQVTGTPEVVRTYVLNPAGEASPSVAAALRQLLSYEPEVKLDKVEFRPMPDDAQQSQWLADRKYGGDSLWDGAKAVVRLPQDAMDVIAQRNAGTARPDEAHPVILTIGHELYHLWRTKMGVNASNPVNQPYEAEASRRMEQVRANWLDQITNNPHERVKVGLPKNAVVEKWEDIPSTERKKIEDDASTNGLHPRASRSEHVSGRGVVRQGGRDLVHSHRAEAR